MGTEYSNEQWNEMVNLLTYVAAADRRTVSEVDVQVWLEAATDGQWPSIEAAYRAVRLHRREQPGKWLEPGHVSVILDRVRQQARASYVPPAAETIPRDVLASPTKYQAYMCEAARRHQAETMAAFAGGTQRLALQAVS